MTRVLTTALLALSLAGCMTDGGSFDAGDWQQHLANDVPDNYRQLIVAEMHRHLKDPYSLRDAEIAKPTRRHLGGVIAGGDRTVVCTRFNAKNSFGAYIGTQTTAFILDGKQVSMSPAVNDRACDSQTYAPFPEAMRKT